MYDLQTSAVQKSTDPRRERPMDKVASAADRISAINERLGTILARFHGHPAGGNDAAENTLSVSYLASIDRLHGNIDVLSKLADELSELA